MSASRREQKPTEGDFNEKKWKKTIRNSVQGNSKHGPEWPQSAPNIIPEVTLKWPQSHFRVTLEWPLSDPKIIPKNNP